MSETVPQKSFGKYQVQKLLGEGAMGAVYLAHDPSLDRHVALKIIRKEVLGGRQAAQMIARFKNEAMAAGRLQHPGIVAVYDFGEDAETSFIVMEYAPGQDLEAYAEEYRPLGLGDVGSIMVQLLDALGYAHSRGVVHRDIKPSNLVVSNQGRIKVTDFGIARIADSKLTQTGMALGTPAYMSPEQYYGTPVDHRADLFSAGVILYELITGQKPFGGDNAQQVAFRICHVEPARPTELDPKLPPAVDGVVLNALAKDKEHRFRTAHDFATAVAAVLGGPPPQQIQAAPRAPTTPQAAPLSPSVLKALEDALAPRIGAIAGALVRRSASKTADPDQLVDLLRKGAGEAGGDPALARDLRALLHAPGRGGTLGTDATIGTPIPVKTASSLVPADLERATQALVGHVGPIARLMVKKAAAQSSDFRELCLRLAESLANDKERKAFLGEVGVK
jgi:eukaryotic-like serine/threonine-protein kinase